MSVSDTSMPMVETEVISRNEFHLKNSAPTNQRRSSRTLLISNSHINTNKDPSKQPTPANAQVKRTIGLGIARRPSDNLLLKLSSIADESAKLSNRSNSKSPKRDIGDLTTSMLDISDLSPPDTQFTARNDRPISDDSIATKTSELFSSPSSGLHSRSSSIEHEIQSLEGNVSNLMMDKSSIISDDNSTLIFHQNINDNKSVSSNNTNILSEIEKPLPPSPQKTRYFFNNGSMNKSSTLNSSKQNHPSSSYMHSNKSAPLLKQSLQNSNASNNNKSNLHHTSVSEIPVKHQNPQLYNHSNSTTAILGTKGSLTASQRYRLRKEQNVSSLRQSIKKKEQYYNEQENALELQEGDIDDSFIWNIPMASYSTSSFLTTADTNSKHQQTAPHHNHQNNPASTGPSTNGPINPFHFKNPSLSALDFGEMPTSPIPGVSKMTDFQYIQNTTKNLSNVYLHSSERLSKSKLNERTKSATFLPLELKEASANGMEDLILVSEDKLDLMSHSRPSWLPPKDPEERRAHEKQISKSMSMASIDQLDRNKDREQRMIKDETNRQKYVLLLDRDVTRNSSIQSLKKLIWDTALTAETRYQMYNDILQSNTKLITEKYLESFSDLLQIINKMDFPKAKEVEIEKLITESIRNKRSGSDDNISNDLTLMLQLKSISSQGLISGDELLFHHFLLDDSFKSLTEVWEVVNLLQMTCFNDLCKEKYDSKILTSRGTIAQHLLRTDDFKDEFNATCLNFNTWWNALERVDHDLFMWIMDIIVVYNSQCFKNSPVKKESFVDKDWEYYRSKKVVVNYSILLSFVLNILLNYHFGFNDLKSLADLDDPNFCIPIPMDDLIDMESVNGLFIRKWLHYQKKF